MFPVGTRLGHYTVLKPLGQGGMAHVYLADDPRHGRRGRPDRAELAKQAEAL